MTSHFVKTISLKDWWLTKADNKSSGNTVAVAGIECAGGKAAHVFSSAPIVERLDIFTLKTADGIFVLLKGPINKQRTCGNGFSEEVFKHFLIGFPFNWEECAEKCFQQGIGSEATADADLNPEQTTVAKMGNTTVKLKQKLWKDSDCNNRRYRPTVRYCNSRAGNHSKAVVPERERKASQGSTSKLRVKRKLDYVHETTCTPEGEHKNSTSQRSILRTSRSGRLLLPTMEFWRNQMPVYDADHGISGIREGSTILKVKTQKVGNRAPMRAMLSRS